MTVIRFFWLILHLLESSLALAWLVVTRRGRPLVFTHYQDLDARPDGSRRDRQMGPLVDALGGCSEVTLVPLGPELFRNWATKRRPCVSHAAVLAMAWLLHPWARSRPSRLLAQTRVAGWLLRALRPKAIFLIDESGSGPPAPSVP